MDQTHKTEFINFLSYIFPNFLYLIPKKGFNVLIIIYNRNYRTSSSRKIVVSYSKLREFVFDLALCWFVQKEEEEIAKNV